VAQLTHILTSIKQGDPRAAEQLLLTVYQELRQLARQRLAQEAAGQTLQATALVHEAYLRLVGESADAGWDGRGHFFAAAAEAMRRILVEGARRKRSIKRGGGLKREDLDASRIEAPRSLRGSYDELLALNEALERLVEHDPTKAQLVKLRYFAGLSMPEVAQSLHLPLRTAERNWAYARVWLLREMTRGDAPN
jgi:RNA polymerase sigma factor (TIGR02999 family)